MEFSLTRLGLIVAVALVAHGIVLGIRVAGRQLLARRTRSETKVHTVTGFVSSLLIFAIYFGAVGFALSEIGVSLTTYLASASVIGLAVSFGSQGVVQDVITGLTVVFSDLLDVGDMVDIGGQVGIVESVGMRFTVLVNFSGARVFVPNRSIGNVVNYPNGYVRAYLDVRLPSDVTLEDETLERVRALADAAYDQFPGVLLLPPKLEGRRETRGGFGFVRTRFRIWPGQGAVLEGPVKAGVIQAMKAIDPHYADWMVTVHYRAEPAEGSGSTSLPRPSALQGGRWRDSPGVPQGRRHTKETPWTSSLPP